MDSVIEQLQKQNGDQFERLGKLEDTMARQQVRLFGNGDDVGTISGRLRTVEGDMGEIKEYIAEEKVTREVLKGMEKRANKRLLLVVAVMGVVMAGISATVSLLA